MKPRLPLSRDCLRPATADDLEDLLSLLHDPLVRRYLCDDALLPRADVVAMLAQSDVLDSRGLGLWIIEDVEQSCVGVAGLLPAPKDAGWTVPDVDGGDAVEPVIALRPGRWRQGLACEALDALTSYARSALDLTRLVAAVDQPNRRSHRLMLRCGFRLMGLAPGPAHELSLYELSL